MSKCTLSPLKGIELDSIKIDLGEAKNDVIQTLGEPVLIEDNSYYFYDNDLRIDFDEDDNVEFIEILGGMEGSIKPEIYGIDPFKNEADKVYELLKEKNVKGISDEECGYAYSFVGISVGVYREAIPDDLEEYLEELEESGINPEDDDDYQYEYQLAHHFSTIGIGVKDYYRW
ncbi:MAG: hypothetical protein IKN54_07020 [Lachnospiraceae bacterium]|nr:hypothetical protein [Lachnospiraceae bacterium]